MNNSGLSKKLETIEELFPIEIDGEKANLVVQAGLIKAIEWENGEKIIVVKEDIDFAKEEQLAEHQGALYQTCMEVLREIEKEKVKPVFSVPRDYANEVLENGLVPRPTWVKDASILASTLGIPYYNKEGNRLLCIPKKAVSFKDIKLKPRLTGKHPAIFQGVVATESRISADKLIFIDTINFEVISSNTEIAPTLQDQAISSIQKKAVNDIENLV